MKQGVKKNIVGKADYSFVLFIFGLSLFGLLVLLSASSYESEKATKFPQTFFLQQAGALLIGMGVMFVTSLIDYRWLRKLGWLLSIFAALCLLLVDFSPMGITAGGSQRWLNLGPFSFQPSEIVKISVLILMADGLAKASWKSWTVLKRLLLCAFMAGLILKEPDLGTAVLVLSSCGCLLLVGGLNLTLALVAGIFGVGGVWLSILNNPYQLQRFQGWLAPEKDPLNTGYNLLQSYYAIGAGGIWGVGYGASLQKLGYLPISYADFIFAIICEELGTTGSVLVVGSFLYLLWKGSQIAVKVPNAFGKLLGIGIVSSILIQAIFNLGGVVGLLPVTGMPLPLISYGKTSLIVLGFMFGILINLSRHKTLTLPIQETRTAKSNLQATYS
jgi:cell division protein FtsW